MQKNRLFAAGLAAALLLGVATPAMAKQPNKGKALGHSASKPGKGPKAGPHPGKKAPPETKGKKHGVSGGGSVNDGEFSIQARLKSKAKGHFNYTSATTKVRCRGFDTFTVPASGQPVAVTFKNCKVNGQALAAPGTIAVTVVDRGDPKAATTATPAVADWLGFSLTNAAAVATAFEGNLTEGNIKVR